MRGVFLLRLVSLPCVRSTQGIKSPAMRVDDTDAMQQNSFPSRMVIVQVAGREGKEDVMETIDTRAKKDIRVYLERRGLRDSGEELGSWRRRSRLLRP